MDNSLYDAVNNCRKSIKETAATVLELKKRGQGSQTDEVVPNIMLAYRHLEDASMRLGKTLQALDGGVSVYDRATTVGA